MSDQNGVYTFSSHYYVSMNPSDDGKSLFVTVRSGEDYVEAVISLDSSDVESPESLQSFCRRLSGTVGSCVETMMHMAVGIMASGNSSVN